MTFPLLVGDDELVAALTTMGRNERQEQAVSNTAAALDWSTLKTDKQRHYLSSLILAAGGELADTSAWSACDRSQ